MKFLYFSIKINKVSGGRVARNKSNSWGVIACRVVAKEVICVKGLIVNGKSQIHTRQSSITVASESCIWNPISKSILKLSGFPSFSIWLFEMDFVGRWWWKRHDKASSSYLFFSFSLLFFKTFLSLKNQWIISKSIQFSNTCFAGTFIIERNKSKSFACSCITMSSKIYSLNRSKSRN